MAKKRQDRPRKHSNPQPLYKSKYGGEVGQDRWVTAAQFLGEVMCERRARVEHKTLGHQFWAKDPYWAGIIRQQIAAANRLMKRLDPEGTGTGAEALSIFLKSEKGRECYSLVGAWIVPEVELAHQKALLYRRQKEEKARAFPAPPSPPPQPVRERQGRIPHRPEFRPITLRIKLENLSYGQKED